MVIDTSALMAIARNEPERRLFLEKLAEAPATISAANLLEARIVMLSRVGEAGVAALRDLIAVSGIRVAPVSAELADAAFTGFRKFGKGRHPAALNFGDCFAYALATSTGEPLLFKGDDFARTDVVPAAPRL